MKMLYSSVQVSDDYDRRLEELSAVERHLVQAKARALADDERAMSTPSTRSDIQLPRGKWDVYMHV